MKIGQNIKYDYMVLRNYGVDLQGRMFDTMLAHYVIQPELQHNMDYMAETLLNYQTVHIEELIGPKGKNQKNMRDLSPQEVYEYAAEDADITLRLKNVLEPRLAQHHVIVFDVLSDLQNLHAPTEKRARAPSERGGGRASVLGYRDAIGEGPGRHGAQWRAPRHPTAEAHAEWHV